MTDQSLPPLAPVPAPTVSPASPPPPVPVRRSGGASWLTALVVLAALFAVGGIALGSFVWWLKKRKRGATGGNGQNGTGNGGNGNGAGGFGNRGNGNGNGFGFGAGGAGAASAGLTIRGTVSAVTADTLTLQLPGGQSVDIPLSTSTTYHRQAGAAAKDVKSGESVAITLTGRFGRGNGAPGNGAPGASASPAASGSAGAGGLGARLGAAADVTITGG